MKKRLSMILGAIAMMATGASSLGCLYWTVDEPNSIGLFRD